MLDQDFFRIGDGGEIHALVPIHQQLRKLVQLLCLLAGQFQLLRGKQRLDSF